MLLVGRSLILALSLLILPGAYSSAQTQPRAQDCVEFIADVTVPDGTPVAPGQAFDKVWLVRNCGSEPWTNVLAVPVDAGFGTEAVPVAATEPGRPAYVYTRLVAPQDAGCQRASYQLSGPRGLIGSSFFAEVLVLGPDTSVEQTMRLGDLLPTVLAPEDLGEHWTRSYSEVSERKGCATGPGYDAFYGNTTDYAATTDNPRGRIVIIGAQVESDVEAAESSIQNVLPPDHSAQAVELGDGSALRQASAGFSSYQFRVGTVSVGLSVNEDGADQAELDDHGMEVAQLAIDRIRTVLAQGPVTPDADAFLTGPPPSLPDLRPLVLPISALSVAWSVSSTNDIGSRYLVDYVKGTDYGAPVVEVRLGLAETAEQAATQVESMRDDLVGMTVNGAPIYQATPWEARDAAYRIEGTEGYVHSVSYVFHVGPYYAEVKMRVRDAQAGQTDVGSEALRLARLQESQLEAAIGSR